MFPLQCLSHLFAISGVSSQISICIKKPPVCGSMDPFWMKAFWTILPFMDVDLWQKMTFNGRWPLTEDNLWWKMTFDGRRPPVFLLFLKHHFGPNIFKTQHFLTNFFHPEINLYTNISLPPTFSRQFARLVRVKHSSPLLTILTRSYPLLPALSRSFLLFPALTRSTFFEPSWSFLTCSDELLFSFLLIIYLKKKQKCLCP